VWFFHFLHIKIKYSCYMNQESKERTSVCLPLPLWGFPLKKTYHVNRFFINKVTFSKPWKMVYNIKYKFSIWRMSLTFCTAWALLNPAVNNWLSLKKFPKFQLDSLKKNLKTNSRWVLWTNNLCSINFANSSHMTHHDDMQSIECKQFIEIQFSFNSYVHGLDDKR